MIQSGLKILVLATAVLVVGCGGGQPPAEVGQAGQALEGVQSPEAGEGAEGAGGAEGAEGAGGGGAEGAGAGGVDGAEAAGGAAGVDRAEGAGGADAIEGTDSQAAGPASPSPSAAPGADLTDEVRVASAVGGSKDLPASPANFLEGQATSVTRLGSPSLAAAAPAANVRVPVTFLTKIRGSTGVPFGMNPSTTTPESTRKWMKDQSLADRVTAAETYMKNQRLSPWGRAALLGAMLKETDRSLDPRKHQYEGGPGRGLLQWTAESPMTSFIELQRWAYERGVDWTDINAQMSFALNQNTGITERLRNPNLTREQAIQAVYELTRQADRNEPERRVFTDRIHANIAAKKPAGTGAAGW